MARSKHPDLWGGWFLAPGIAGPTAVHLLGDIARQILELRLKTGGGAKLTPSKPLRAGFSFSFSWKEKNCTILRHIFSHGY
jgi:hypothetical protein